LGIRYEVRKNDEVKRLLRASARYLKRAKKVKGNRVSATKIENAIISSVFSAAAVEAGMNIFLKWPLLFINDKYVQNFYGQMLNELRGMPAPRKVDLVSRFCSGLRGNKKLRKRVLELFSYRNKILHVSPEYVERFGLPDNFFDTGPVGSREIPVEELVRNAAIAFTPPNDMSLRDAAEHYEIAEEFLKFLISFEKGKKGAG
jgi:hypothetical protein